MLNRAAVTVRAKQPFLDWLQGLPDPAEEGMTLGELDEDRSVYLIPDCYDEDEFNQHLAGCFDIIFEAELEGWWTDEAAWPEERTLELFLEWFEVEFHSMLVDLVDGPLVDDDQ